MRIATTVELQPSPESLKEKKSARTMHELKRHFLWLGAILGRGGGGGGVDVNWVSAACGPEARCIVHRWGS